LKQKFDYKRTCKIALWMSGMLILLFFTVIWYWTIEYNNNDYTTDDSISDAPVFLEADSSEDVVDTWDTVMQLSDDPENVEKFTGATFSERIVNNNTFDISDWELRMVVNDECYLNSFWCGSIIINQHRNGNTISELVESQYSDFSQSNLEMNNYSNNMMIHLQPGDEIVYIPSERENEDVVKAREFVGIGFIFYFKDKFEISSWKLTYHNNIKLFDLLSTKIAFTLAVIWVGALAFYITLAFIEKKMKEQMNSRIKNISIMSDIYIEAYMVDIKEDSARLIKGNRDNLIVGLEGTNVQETINNAVRNKCLPAYHEELLRFLDLSTVMERMEHATNITTEFIGNTIGWCAVRIFKEEGNSNNIVITLQDINEEKKKLRLIEEKINLAEHKQHVSGSFLGTVSFALNDISRKVGMDANEILSNSDRENVKSLAEKIINNTRHMNLIQNTMLDLYNIESQTLELDVHRYSTTDMLGELYRILSVYAEDKPFKFSFDIDNSIPEYLVGDGDRIEQILIIILFSSMLMTQQGFVSFSLYGKRIDDEEEMIFTIRDSAGGFSKEQLDEIHEFINGSSIETFDNASLVYLKIINGILNAMNSELKIVSVLNEGTDFYFTLRQEISKEQ